MAGERGDRGRRGRAALLQATFGEDKRHGIVLHATTGIENCYHHVPYSYNRNRDLLHRTTMRFLLEAMLIFAGTG